MISLLTFEAFSFASILNIFGGINLLAVNGVLEAVLEVFSSIGSWIAEAVQAVIPIFWVSETGLTFMGVLAVSGLGFSVMFLMIGIIQNFLHFRG